MVSDDVTDPIEDTVTTPVANDSELDLVKSDPINSDEGASNSVTLGDTLTYTITATNTGLGVETNLTVIDTLLSPESQTCVQVLPGETCVLTGTYTVVQADVDAGEIINTASVTSDNLPDPQSDSITTSVEQTGDLRIVKADPINIDEDGSGNVSLNDTLTYVVTATNAGTTTQTNVFVTDALLTPSTRTCASVVPGGTCVLTGSYDVNQDDVDRGEIVNTASVVSDDVVDPVRNSVTTPVSQVVELQITKSDPTNADEDGTSSVTLGDTLTYIVTVTNSGNTTQSNVVVSDALLTPSSQTCATVAPGEICILTGTLEVSIAQVSAGEVINTASVVSDDVTDPIEDTVTTPVANDSDLDLVKSDPVNADEDGSNSVTLDDTLTYTIAATNIGLGVETNVTVVDPLLSPDTQVCLQVLPGETCVLTGTYTATQADVDTGEVVNTASVTSDSLPDPLTDTVTTPVEQVGELRIEKSDPANTDEDATNSVTLNDTLTYTVTATNDGSTTQTNVVVSDGLLTPSSQTCALVAPGGTCVLTGSLSVSIAQSQAGEVVNTASVVSDQVIDPIEDSVTTPVANGAILTIVKSDPINADEDSTNSVSLGDTLTYTVTSTNPGPGVATGVTVFDLMLTPPSQTCAQVLPSGTLSLIHI